MLPILKWTGGKRKLIENIKKYFPDKYNRYFEPFIGGGALFFNLEIENSTICDSNSELINFYKIVRDFPNELLEESDKHINDKEYYLSIREWDRLDTWIEKTDLERAGRFLYLNKTAYSGMWRVNLSNQHNVPFADYKSVRLFGDFEKYIDKELLIKASNLLKTTNIIDDSYKNIQPNNNDLVYLDPPYDNTWTNYTKEGFNKNSQEDLADYCFELDQENINFILSNNSTENIFNLYEGFNIIEVKSGQSISGRHDKGEKRKKATEVIIKNF